LWQFGDCGNRRTDGRLQACTADERRIRNCTQFSCSPNGIKPSLHRPNPWCQTRASIVCQAHGLARSCDRSSQENCRPRCSWSKGEGRRELSRRPVGRGRTGATWLLGPYRPSRCVVASDHEGDSSGNQKSRETWHSPIIRRGTQSANARKALWWSGIPQARSNRRCGVGNGTRIIVIPAPDNRVERRSQSQLRAVVSASALLLFCGGLHEIHVCGRPAVKKRT
jgi:hypothetical protein